MQTWTSVQNITINAITNKLMRTKKIETEVPVCDICGDEFKNERTYDFYDPAMDGDTEVGSNEDFKAHHSCVDKVLIQHIKKERKDT